MHTLSGHTGSVVSVAFSPDGRTLASASQDGTIRLCNPTTSDSMALLATRTGDTLIYTDDGYWDGSRAAGMLVAMVKGDEGFAVDQFAIKNNRPDIILKRLGLGTPELIEHYREQYEKRLRKLERLYKIKESDLSGELHVPQAKITSTKTVVRFNDIDFNYQGKSDVS